MTDQRDRDDVGRGDAPADPAERVTFRSNRPDPSRDEVYETSGLRVALVILAIVAVGLYFSWSATLIIVGIVVMITLHELGHFLTAKWAGMKVTEFFFGFGPRLWSFHRGETEYGVKAIPAGAYVRIIGMNNLDDVAPQDEARSYRQQSFPKRLVVVLAGPATHFIQAFVIVFLLLAATGMPGGEAVPQDPRDSDSWVVDDVTEDSAAQAAGLEPGDRIVEFDGRDVRSWNDVTDRIENSEVGDEIILTVLRDSSTIETTTRIGGRPRNLSGAGAEEGDPFLGVGPEFPEYANEKLGVFEALVETPGQTADATWEAVSALGGFFSPSGIDRFADKVSEGADDEPATSSPSGGGGSGDTDEDGEGRLLSIIGAVGIGADLAEEGWRGVLLFFLSINIFVGLINLVPLLPFDGGHASVAIYERIRSRNGVRYHADVTKLLPFAYVVVMGLVVLGITTMYLDIVNPVRL